MHNCRCNFKGCVAINNIYNLNFCRQNISYIVRFLLIKSYKKSCKLLSNYTENYVDIKRNKRQTKVKTFAEKVVE